jgi:sirohydrochlorin cobaltochelatase
MNKKALLTISFGTSYKDTFEKTIKVIEDDLKSMYPDHDFFRAYTSRMIINKLKKRDGIAIDLPAEALEKIKIQGYKEVLCQPTHIINGVEYDMTIDDLKPFCKNLNIKIGKPLLTEEEDYRKSVKGVISEIKPLGDDEALILMGHGTYHHANSAYSCLDYVFKSEGYSNVYVASVEGFPYIDEVISRIKDQGNIRKVILMPFMIVAGDHARNDMAGDEEDSWLHKFKNEGFEVEIVMKGLGEIKAIRDIFVEHSKKTHKLIF